MLLTVSEVAKLLKVNRNFVYNAIKSGELKAIRVGSIKIKREDVEDYINRKEFV